MGAKGIKVMGGVIDNKYRGEIIVVLANVGGEQSYYDKRDEIVIRPGDKIAQLLILPLLDINIEETNELGTTERDSKGFGSSGA
jgi:dUTP pyrophosphatase